MVLKSAFQTAAFAGYPNITIQIRGAPEMFDAAAQVPGPPDPTAQPQVPEKVMFVTVGGDGAEVAWKRGVEVLSTASLRPSEVSRGICDQWLQNGAHVDASDPKIDQLILRVDDAFTAADVAPYFDAIKSCVRKMPDGTEGRALEMTFSIR